MSKSIVPKSEQSRKSNPTLNRLNQNAQLLAGWIEETERAISALQAWLDKLRSWQSQEKVSPKEFAEACSILDHANLSEWAEMGLDKLQAAVTEEQTVQQP